MKKLFLIGICSTSVVFIMFFGMIFWNRFQLKPTEEEVKILNQFYGNIKINRLEDIIRLQNITIDSIFHEDTGTDELSVTKTIKLRKGQCFDRSMILQKIMAYNNFEISPIYMYFNTEEPLKTSIFDIFNSKTHSHNLFVFKYKDKWNVMRTNTKMVKLESIDQYLKSEYLPLGTKYFEHLNNRNGRFIFPTWLPDIY